VADRELTIRLKIDRSQAAAMAGAEVAEQTRIVAAHKAKGEAAESSAKRAGDTAAREASKAADAESRETKRLLTETEVAERAKMIAIARTNRAAVEGQVKLLQVVREAGTAGKEAGHQQAEGMGLAEKTAISLGSSVIRMGASYLGLQAGKAILTNLGQAAQQADIHQKKLSDDVERHRDALREIKALEGGKSNTQAVVEATEYQAKTGLTSQEAIEGRTQFLNSGAQFEGKKISSPEFKQLQEQAGALAAAEGAKPGELLGLAGQLIGTRDFKPFGDNASEEALGQTYRGFKILGRGSGDNPILLKQSQELLASLHNEDAMKGVFQNTDDVFTSISVAAEKNQGEAATLVKSANKGLREFDNPLIKKAGITPKTQFLDAIKLLDPIVTKEAQDSGTKVDDVLRKNFEDFRTAEGIGVFLNKGLGGGVIKDRQNYAKGGVIDGVDYGSGLQGTAPALDSIKAAQNDPDGPVAARISNAQLDLSNTKRGSETLLLKAIRTRAEAKLAEPKQPGGPQIDTTSTFFKDKVLDAVNPDRLFGWAPSTRDRRITDQVKVDLKQRAENAGITFDDKVFKNVIGAPSNIVGQATPESMDKRYATIAEQLQRFGVNPLVDTPRDPSRAGQPLNDKTAEIMQALTQALVENTKATQANSQQGQPAGPAAPGQRPIPAPLGQGPGPRGGAIRPGG
jgi:hypothetical protein